MSATGWLFCLGTLLYSGRQFPAVETMLRDEQRVARHGLSTSAVSGNVCAVHEFT